MRKICLTLAAFLAAPAFAVETPSPVPPLRQQADIQQQWLKLRLERNLPMLMRKHGVSMWLVVCREYAEDPAFYSLVSPTMFAARRRTMYVFYDQGAEKGVERLALGGGSNGGLYTVYRDPAVENREIYGEGQWALLKKLIEERKPATIALDISATHAFSDGLTTGEYQKLSSVLGPEWMSRVVHAENLALEYQEMRVPEMMPVYQDMMKAVHSLIERAFSREVIQPGKTTNLDVVWWLRQKVNDMGLGTWFHPSVRVQTKSNTGVQMLSEDDPVVIQRGDVLHVDFGITAMRLNTDTQHMGYVLREGETDVPAGLKHALAATNRLQEIVMAELRTGRSGNQILQASLEKMRSEKIDGTIYSHPIGDHGHAAGPLIGLWDRQEGVPGRGDVTVIPDSWFSIELQATTPVPEWDNKPVFVGLEEDAAVDSQGRVNWVYKPQKAFHIVR